MCIEQMLLHAFCRVEVLLANRTGHCGSVMHTIDMFVEMAATIEQFVTKITTEFLFFCWSLLIAMHSFHVHLE